MTTEHVEPTAEQQVRGVQAWMALDLHMALGLPVDHSADVEHQGRRSWSDWWAELLHRVRVLPKEPAPPAEPTSRLREALTTAREALDLGRGCPDYSDHGPSEEWHCEGCLEAKAVEEAIAAIDAALADTPAPPAELTEAQRLAEQVIKASFRDGVAYMGLAEFLPPGTDDDTQRRVGKLVDAAEVAVSWPEPAAPEQDGGQAEGGL